MVSPALQTVRASLSKSGFCRSGCTNGVLLGDLIKLKPITIIKIATHLVCREGRAFNKDKVAPRTNIMSEPFQRLAGKKKIPVGGKSGGRRRAAGGGGEGALRESEEEAAEQAAAAQVLSLNEACWSCLSPKYEASLYACCTKAQLQAAWKIEDFSDGQRTEDVTLMRCRQHDCGLLNSVDTEELVGTAGKGTRFAGLAVEHRWMRRVRRRRPLTWSRTPRRCSSGWQGAA